MKMIQITITHKDHDDTDHADKPDLKDNDDHDNFAHEDETDHKQHNDHDHTDHADDTDHIDNDEHGSNDHAGDTYHNDHDDTRHGKCTEQAERCLGIFFVSWVNFQSEYPCFFVANGKPIIHYIIVNNIILKSNSSVFPQSKGYIYSTLPREYTDKLSMRIMR